MKKLKLSNCVLVLLMSNMLFANNVSANNRIDPNGDFSNVAQRLIVRYKKAQQNDMLSNAQVLSQRANKNIRFMRNMALKRSHLFQLDRRLSPKELRKLKANLATLPDIEAVEEDVLMQANLTPNDPYYHLQWHYHDVFDEVGGINLPMAWDLSTGQGIVVAVLDTGSTAHADLAANFLPGYDFIASTFVSNDGNGRDNDASDPGDWMEANECGINNPASFSPSSWHGTHVAGTIAALSDNNLGVSGVAFNTTILPVRVLGKCGGYLSDIADAIVWASGGTVAGVPDNAHPAQVINLSLGTSGNCGSLFQDAILEARANGATVVVSAGNSAQDAVNYQPASCDGVLSVAASDRDGNRAYYSNFGTKVDIAAPGGGSGADGVGSTLNDGLRSPGNDDYAYYQGTSMSAPHVSGAAALLYSINANMNPDTVESILTSTARAMPGTCSGGCGAGLLDAYAAVLAASGGAPVNDPPVSSFTKSIDVLQVTFTDTSTDSDGNIVAWDWDFGDGLTSNQQSPVHDYADSGTYTVTLTVTDDQNSQHSSNQVLTVDDTPTGSTEMVYVSSNTGGTVGGVKFMDEDILSYDAGTDTWAMFLDGSDIGLNGSPARDVDAFHLMDDGSILISLVGDTSIPDVGIVDDSDIVRFVPASMGATTAGRFEMYFDGSDVELTSGGEDIDAIGFAPDGRLVVSTSGNVKVAGISGKDEDLLAFTPVTLGNNTTGSWAMYFDGSDVGLNNSSDEDVWDIWIDSNTGDIYMTTRGTYNVTGASGTGADIFKCTPGSIGSNTACTFSPYWQGVSSGFGGERMDGFSQMP